MAIPSKFDISSVEFIDGIVRSVKSGYGITPFTGAGVSVRSGIMGGRDFTEYLTWVIYLCLGSPGGPEGTRRQTVHDIRGGGWPDRPSSGDVSAAKEWVQKSFIKIAADHGLKLREVDGVLVVDNKAPDGSASASPESNRKLHAGPGEHVWSRPMVPAILSASEELKNQDKSIRRLLTGDGLKRCFERPSDPNMRADSRAGLTEVAIRAMFDWRAMLAFLACVTVKISKPVLLDHDPSVIDSFNQHITRGRKPNLTHTMLAHLAGPLRTRVLVTTNFDSLHEESFRQLGIPFETHSVTKAQGLPAVDTVRASTAIIKFHGTATGTRADFSLDEPPTRQENATFFEYVVGHAPYVEDADSSLPSHLLVIGASGSDVRCLHYIKHLLDASDDTKVFWVCHNHAAMQDLQRLFSDCPERLFVTMTDRADLLLLELYQSLTLTLPKGGFSYQYSHDVPPKLWRNEKHGEEALTLAVQASVDEVYAALQAAERTEPGTVRPAATRRGLFAVLQSYPTLTPKAAEPYRIPSGISDEMKAVLKRGVLRTLRPKLSARASTNEYNSACDQIYERAGALSIIRTFRKAERPPLEAEQSLQERLVDALMTFDDRIRIEPAGEVSFAGLVADLLSAGLRPTEHEPAAAGLFETARRCAQAFDLGQRCEVQDTGLVPVITAIFNRVRNELKKEVVWIELEDFADVPELVHYVLHIISLRRGMFQLEHAMLLPGRLVERRETILRSKHDRGALRSLWDEVITNALRYLGEDAGRYVIAFYGRNVPGSCAGWDAAGVSWTKKKYQELHQLFDVLTQQGMHVLYVPLTRAFLSSTQDHLSQWIPRAGQSDRILPTGAAHPPAGSNVALLDIDSDTVCDENANGRDVIHLATNRRAAKMRIGEVLRNLGKSLAPGAGTGVPKVGDEADQGEGREAAELGLLYGMSLFRQSRPPGVFLSDPVFTSDYRFNARGIDSDWDKSKKVAEWLENYRRDELMWRKPGGNSWMYRDGRVGLRLMVEQVHSELGQRGHYQSRTHFWIARWYFRAFCSSGHAVPLLEAFHHFYQCVLTVAHAFRPGVREPDQQLAYRKQRMIRALSEWIKVIRLGQSTILFWFDRPAIHTWFGREARDLIHTRVLNGVDDLWPGSRGEPVYAHHLVEALRLELERCDLSCRRELSLPVTLLRPPQDVAPSGISTSWVRKTEIFRALGEQTWWEERERDGTRDKLDGRAMADKIIGQLWQNSTDQGPSRFKAVKGVAFGYLVNEAELGAMLPVALGILKERMYELVRLAKSVDCEAALTKDATSAGSPLSLKAKLATHRRIIPASTASRDTWTSVTILGRIILDLCAFCPAELLMFDMNIRVTVLTLHALALGRLGRFYQAHRRLNEARALLTRIALQPGEGTDFAIIELRRAEVYLLEADQVAAVAGFGRESAGDQVVFASRLGREIRNDLGAQPGLGDARAKRLQEQLDDVYELAQLEHLPRILVAKLDDAWSSIETSEQLLSGHVRTSLSWGRLCNLKLRFFAHHTEHEIGEWRLLALRRHQDLSSELSRWLRLGFANWPDDPFRQARIAWYFFRAKENWRGQSNVQSRDDEDAALIAGLVENWERDTDKGAIARIENCRESLFAYLGGAYNRADPKAQQRESLRKLANERLSCLRRR